MSDVDINLTSGVELDWEWSWPPVSVNARQYVWHKQALFKGRSGLYGTAWAGWGFWEWLMGGRVYEVAEANALPDDALRVEPVFRHNPDEMFSSNIVKAVQNNILARGIPELSYPAGYTNLSLTHCMENIDMQDLQRADGIWPQRDIVFGQASDAWQRWLHTDLMNLAYFHTHRLFEAIVTRGGMK